MTIVDSGTAFRVTTPGMLLTGGSADEILVTIVESRAAFRVTAPGMLLTGDSAEPANGGSCLDGNVCKGRTKGEVLEYTEEDRLAACLVGEGEACWGFPFENLEALSVASVWISSVVCGVTSASWTDERSQSKLESPSAPSAYEQLMASDAMSQNPSMSLGPTDSGREKRGRVGISSSGSSTEGSEILLCDIRCVCTESKTSSSAGSSPPDNLLGLS